MSKDVCAYCENPKSEHPIKAPIYCKYCGSRLRKDSVGSYCPEKNCSWNYGLDDKSECKKFVKDNKGEQK